MMVRRVGNEGVRSQTKTGSRKEAVRRKDMETHTARVRGGTSIV